MNAWGAAGKRSGQPLGMLGDQREQLLRAPRERAARQGLHPCREFVLPCADAFGDAERERCTAAGYTGDRLRTDFAAFLDKDLVGGAEQAQLHLRPVQLQIEHRERRKGLLAQTPGEIGGAGVGVGGLERGEHGSAPRASSGGWASPPRGGTRFLSSALAHAHMWRTSVPADAIPAHSGELPLTVAVNERES
ncbi:hypothetical protein GCM10020000_42280 [Streptomyces olivoverticillatus]